MALEPVLPRGFSSSPLTVVQVWVEIWGWVGAGGPSSSHHPPHAGLGLLAWRHDPAAPSPSGDVVKPFLLSSFSSHGSAWGSAVSLWQQHCELVSCTGGVGEQSVCQDQERAGLCTGRPVAADLAAAIPLQFLAPAGTKPLQPGVRPVQPPGACLQLRVPAPSR